MAQVSQRLAGHGIGADVVNTSGSQVEDRAIAVYRYGNDTLNAALGQYLGTEAAPTIRCGYQEIGAATIASMANQAIRGALAAEGIPIPNLTGSQRLVLNTQEKAAVVTRATALMRMAVSQKGEAIRIVENGRVIYQPPYCT